MIKFCWHDPLAYDHGRVNHRVRECLPTKIRVGLHFFQVGAFETVHAKISYFVNFA